MGRGQRRTRKSGERPSPAPVPATRAASRWHLAAGAAALVALTLVVYAQVGHFPFVNWDDPEYITKNPTVLTGLNWAAARWAFTNTVSPNWHPLTWLSHELDVTLFGADAGAPHLVNVGWHALNAIGIFLLFAALTRRIGRSFVLAAIFAVHPIHVESVAWISERKDVLSACLAIATIGRYARYVAKPSVGRSAVVALLFALAIMAKPMVVTLPVLLLILDEWPLRRSRDVSWSRRLVEKAPLFVIAAVDSVMTIRLQASAGAMASMASISLAGRIEQALSACLTYMWQAVWPVHLVAFYPRSPVSAGEAAAAALVLTAITAGAIRVRARAPYVLAGWAWFLVTLAPVIGLLQAGEQAHADRYMYLALVGLLVVAVWGIGDLLDSLRYPTVVGTAIAGTAIALCVPLAHAQAATWSDSLSLWQHAAAVTSGNYKAAEKIGEAYRDLGRLDEARASYADALRLALPNSPRYLSAIHDDIGLVWALGQRDSEAAAEFATATALNPSNVEAHINLGNALAARGDFDEAAGHFAAALRADPTAAEAEIGLGNVLLNRGRAADALVHFERATSLNPDLADAQNGLGVALTETGQPDRALPAFARALRLRPAFPNAELNAAIALVKLGRLDEARSHLQDALRLRPDLEPARALLAQIGGR